MAGPQLKRVERGDTGGAGQPLQPESLSLSDNGLSGEIPAELGSLSNLTFLNLSGNELSGEIPAELGNLSNLTILFLERQRLERGDTGGAGQPLQPEGLYLNDNELSGEIPAELGSLSNLNRWTLTATT